MIEKLIKLPNFLNVSVFKSRMVIILEKTVINSELKIDTKVVYTLDVAMPENMMLIARM